VGAPRDLGNAATPWEKDDTIRAETGLLVAALDDVLSLEHVEPLAFVCGDVLLAVPWIGGLWRSSDTGLMLG
jgi:hypothetical protein